ncbi:MAG: DUF2235 domain-containing protein [Candidatus Competibacteraceae bacterium]
MPKNIVLLSDGTGNSAGKLSSTNVWRLYQALDLSKPPANTAAPEQIAYYDNGVGTSSFRPLALLGGAFGWGLKRNVIDLYTFLCWNYVDGDQIYCFGFSRGAFTIRVLTGLIHFHGLVDKAEYKDSKEELRRLATRVFREFRHDCAKKKSRLVGYAWTLGKKAADHCRLYGPPSKKEGPAIAFLGLWDTVAAYGLPIDELTRAWDFIFPLSTPKRDLVSNVERACHALALDDERNTFHPVLWNEENESGNSQTKNICDERITQVWFCGMHSNVGGGYPDDALAYVSLDWMVDMAGQAGLKFKPDERKEIKAKAYWDGKMEDSRHGLGGSYRYLPRKLEVLTEDIDDKDNKVVIERPKIHESVLKRIKSGTDGYAPIVLPPRYAVVTADDGHIHDMPKSAHSQAIPPSAPAQSCLIENETQALNRSRDQEKVWDLVWWKRVAYFASVIVAGLLAAFPLYRPATAACENFFCALSPVIRMVGTFLPGFTSFWLDAYRSHPFTFSVLLVLLIAFIYWGSRLQDEIFKQMRELWAPFRKPGSPPVEKFAGSRIYNLRTNSLYQSFFKFMKRYLLPSVAGLIALALILAGINKSLFEMRSSAGFICTPTEPGALRQDRLERGVFPSNALCWASGVELKKGKRYRISLTVDPKGIWMDGDIPAGISGLEKTSCIMSLGFPFRRYLREPWFKPIARIGHHGSDEYPLDPVDGAVPTESTDKMVAEITARRSGELFLFVNDGVLPVPEAWQGFYRNNQGTATVTVQPITELTPAE